MFIIFYKMENSNLRTSSYSHESNSLYEEVLAKNFEIIENFLSRFHSVFSSNQCNDHRVRRTRACPQKC